MDGGSAGWPTVFAATIGVKLPSHWNQLDRCAPSLSCLGSAKTLFSSSLGPRSPVLISMVNPLPVAETGLCRTVSEYTGGVVVDCGTRTGISVETATDGTTVSSLTSGCPWRDHLTCLKVCACGFSNSSADWLLYFLVSWILMCMVSLHCNGWNFDNCGESSFHKPVVFDCIVFLYRENFNVILLEVFDKLRRIRRRLSVLYCVSQCAQ